MGKCMVGGKELSGASKAECIQAGGTWIEDDDKNGGGKGIGCLIIVALPIAFYWLVAGAW